MRQSYTNKRMRKKAQAFTFLAALIVLIGVGALYVLLSPSAEKVVSFSSSDIDGSSFEVTANKMTFLWGLVPFAVFLLVFLFLFAESQRRPF